MPISRHLELVIVLDLKWPEMSHKMSFPEVLKHASDHYVLSFSLQSIYFMKSVRPHNTV